MANETLIKKEVVLMTINEYYNLGLAYLDKCYRDGWSVDFDKETKLVIFQR